MDPASTTGLFCSRFHTCAHSLSLSPVHDFQAWECDLCSHGDVHPNPGPTSPVETWSCNVGKGAGAWELVRLGISKQIPILAIQETGLKESEQLALQRFAEGKGYRAYAASAILRQQQAHGGVMLLVHKNYRSRLILDIAHEECQAVTVMVENAGITCLYQPPNGLRLPLCSFVEESRYLLPPQTAWVGMGDFNDIPSEACLCTSFEDDRFVIKAVKNVEGELLPTRWGGNRAIDFFIANCHDLVQEPWFHEEAIADHRIVCTTLTLVRGCTEPVSRWFKATKKDRPPNFDKKVWDKIFLEKWNKLTKPDYNALVTQQDVDTAWAQTECCFELALNHACRHAAQALETPTIHHFYGSEKGQIRFQKGYPKVGNVDFCTDTYQIRKFRNAVGRLSEMRRLEQAGKTDTNDYKNLKVKVVRAIGHLPGNTVQKLNAAASKLHECRSKHQENRCSAWRRKMQQSDAACFRWLGTQASQPHRGLFSADLEQHVPTCSNQEDLKMICDYWLQVWERPSPNPAVYKEAVEASGLLQPAIPQSWGVLDAKDFSQAACKLKGKAAGVDRWSGSEVASIPTEALHSFALFTSACERLGKIPTVWNRLRQIHLPKSGKGVRGDGARDVASLRPVAISSSWYRLWASTRLASEQTQAWIQQWVPSQACGGIKGRDISHALGPIVKSIRQEKFLISLDYSLAFDHCSPATTTWLLQRLGLPPGIGSMLMAAWSQQRYIEYDGCVLTDPQQVHNSLPQGDPWSMYGLIALLSPPTRQINAQFPSTIHRTYVDDRTWASPTCAQALAVQQCWAHWSNLLGLKENPTKAQYFHPSIKGRREFLDSGVSQDKVTDRPCVLGCHLQGLVRRQLCDKETKRLKDAATKVRKLCRLPVPQARKQHIAAAAPVAKAEHGWIEKLPPQSAFKIVERAVSQLCDEPKNTAPHLRRLYRNHRIDVQSRVLQNLVDMAIRHVRSSGAACPCPWSHWHGWSGNIHRLLLLQGWECTSPWKWRHSVTGISLSLLARDRPDLAKTRHDLREGLRAHCFKQWQGTTRNDAEACRNVPYSTWRCKLARQLSADCPKRQHFMCGALKSPAAFTAPQGKDVTCPFCNKEPGTTDHVLWHCTGLPERPPCPRPRDSLAARMAWPTGHANDEAIIQWAVKVREWIRLERYKDA